MDKINFQDLPSTSTPLNASNLNAMQTNAENAINAVNKAINVTTAGTNLDNYKTAGLYYFSTSYTPTNVPSGVNNGILEVITSGENEFVKQIFYRAGTTNSNDYETYIRTYNNSSSSWGSWVCYAPIQKNSAQVSTAGWYRVAKITGTGHPASTAILSISTNYSYSVPSSVLVSVLTTWQKAKITQLNSAIYNAEIKSLTKVRVVYDSTNSCFYIDVYYNLSASNSIFVKNENLLRPNIEILQPILASSASGTTLQELTISY